MNQSNSSKQVLLSVIGVAILVVAVVGVSFAFFNYTRTGNVNRIKTGQIAFTTTQSQINIENVFPVAANTSADDPNVQSATVTITGDTTYAYGLDYRVTATNIDFTVSDGETLDVKLPVRMDISVSGNLNKVNSLAHNGTTEVLVHPVSGQTRIDNGYVLAEGHIATSAATAYTGSLVNGTITINAYLDKAEIAITDTLEGQGKKGGTETGYTDGTANGTTSTWVGTRTRMTTTQWNNLANDPLRFTITVEAVEAQSDYAFVWDTPYVPTYS